jgi:starch-binding outer membrane protein, SusD/RagB family
MLVFRRNLYKKFCSYINYKVMKQILIKQLIRVGKLVIFILFFSACNKDLLKTVPDTSISDVTAFDTPERVASQVNGLYSALKSSDFLGGRYLIFNELRADEFLMGNPDPGQAMNVWGQTINSGSGEVINMWAAGYQAINRVNTFLAGLDEHKEVVSETLYNEYVAEAKFVRAIAYYCLVQVYAKPFALDDGASPGLPLRLQRENSGQNNDLARSSVADVYTQILKDLDEAEAALPSTYYDNYLNTVKAHKNTAIALKTRIKLTKGDYSGVIDEASKIVSLTDMSSPSGVAFKLETNLSDLYSGSYTGSEAIFYMPFSSADAGSLITYYFRAPPAAGSGYYPNPDGILSNPALSDPDDQRSQFIVSAQDQKWLKKYDTPNPNTDYVPVMRYAEVLLNYAEAAAHSGQLETAAKLLEAVRKRSDEGYIFNNTDLTNQTSLTELILTEKRIEFLGEGFRVPDLQRLLQPIPGKTSPSGSAPTLQISQPLYIWPISSEEIGTNSLMVPN